MKKSVLICLLGFISYSSFAQSTCNCCSEEYMQFDYWLGEWEVFDTSGNIIGENSIVYHQDSCLIQENWKSATSTGTSYSYYNRQDSSWNQVWVDNRGGNLVLKGKAEDGVILMQTKINAKGQIHQISWTPNTDGSVIQRWDVLDVNNKIVATLFYGIYKSKT